MSGLGMDARAARKSRNKGVSGAGDRSGRDVKQLGRPDGTGHHSQTGGIGLARHLERNDQDHAARALAIGHTSAEGCHRVPRRSSRRRTGWHLTRHRADRKGPHRTARRGPFSCVVTTNVQLHGNVRRTTDLDRPSKCAYGVTMPKFTLNRSNVIVCVVEPSEYLS